MNPIIIILAVLFIVLMVAFGRNPVEDAREKRAAAMAGKDPLVEAIEEHNKLQGNGFSLPEAPYNPANPNMTNNTGYPAYLQRNGQNPYLNGQNPYAAANPYRTPQMPVPAESAAPQNSYYPPPPLSNSSLPPHSDLELDRDMQRVMPYLNLPGQGTMHLASGQRIGFVGTGAYALDEQGRPRPLPDGKYAMYEGRVTITIRNGHKVVN